VYRFKGTAVANKITTLTVKEESVSPTTIAILSADVGQLLQYSRTNEIPKEVRDALAKAAQMRQSLVDVERDINARSQHIAEITAEQTRIRENMKTVSQTSQYYQRLLSKLNEQESAIEGLQKERDDLAAKRDDLRRQLEEYLNGLTLG
jgi:chromosome segregation ATPase